MNMRNLYRKKRFAFSLNVQEHTEAHRNPDMSNAQQRLGLMGEGPAAAADETGSRCRRARRSAEGAVTDDAKTKHEDNKPQELKTTKRTNPSINTTDKTNRLILTNINFSERCLNTL